jgi:hypothetical protein
VTQEKDQKADRGTGPGRIASKTLVGVAAMPSSRPPRPSERASRPPAGPARATQAKVALGREFFATLGPKREAPKPATAQREKQASLEEISSSMLLEDDSSSAVMPGLEELSGSLLLEDPTEVRADLAAPAPAAQPAVAEREPPAAHRALLGIPELPTSTPAPNLDALPPMPQPSAPALHPPSRESSAAAYGASEGPDGDDPTRVVPPPPQHMYEALKGYESHAVGPDAGPDTGSRVPQAAPVQPMPQTWPPVQGDVEMTTLPVSGWVAALDSTRQLIRKFRASLGEATPATAAEDAKRLWFLFAIGFGGLVVGIGFVALVVSLTRKATDETSTASEATETNKKNAIPEASAARAPAASETAQLAPVAPVAAPAPARQEPSASTTPCVVAGAARIVAPSAIVSAGIEVRAVGDDVALGFAPDEHQATALRLDASSLAVDSKVDAQSSESIRRVVPLASSDGALGVAEDADREGDALQGRRTIALDPPLDIGSAGGSLVFARPNGAAAGKLWPLDGDGSVEALRGSSDPTQSAPVVALAFRHGGAIWLGAATGRDALAPLGPLTRAGGSSAGVGSPAIAVSGGVALAAWADRDGATDPWRLKWVSFKAGEAPGEPGTFTPPAGGRGEQAMSPGIAAVPGGRFLLVWTEGPATRHDVRALTLSRGGQPLGKPLVISSKNMNAGQGQGAVNGSGRGAVAFLASAAGGFQVVATPIKCAP